MNTEYTETLLNQLCEGRVDFLEAGFTTPGHPASLRASLTAQTPVQMAIYPADKVPTELNTRYVTPEEGLHILRQHLLSLSQHGHLVQLFTIKRRKRKSDPDTIA